MPVVLVLDVASATHEVSRASKRVGFRDVEVVRETLPDAQGLTFYFRVNDIPIYAKVHTKTSAKTGRGGEWVGWVGERGVELKSSSFDGVYLKRFTCMGSSFFVFAFFFVRA